MANYKHYARTDPARLDKNGKKHVPYVWASWEWPDRFDEFEDLLPEYVDDVEIYTGRNRRVSFPLRVVGEE